MGAVEKRSGGDLHCSMCMPALFLYYFLKSDCAFKQNLKVSGVFYFYFTGNLNSAVAELHFYNPSVDALSAAAMPVHVCKQSLMSADIIREHSSTLNTEIAQITIFFFV